MIESDIPTIQNIQSLNIRNNGIYNITPNFPNEYITKAEINVDVPTTITELQNKTININQNGTEIVSADMGYDALGSVTINTNIPSSSINTQQKTVNIEENGAITVNPDPGYALSKVNVNTNVFTWDEIINELPLEIDLRTDHSKKAVFYVPGVSDYNTSSVPYTIAYQNKQGQIQQKVVATMKPFRIINFYEDDIFRENGNYYISFNNYNESIVANKYKQDNGHILLHNREAPINNFGFRINVKNTFVANAIRLNSELTPVPFAMAGQWYRRPGDTTGTSGTFYKLIPGKRCVIEFHNLGNSTTVNILNNTRDDQSGVTLHYNSIYGEFGYEDWVGLGKISLMKTSNVGWDDLLDFYFNENYLPTDDIGIQELSFTIINETIDYKSFEVTDVNE